MNQDGACKTQERADLIVVMARPPRILAPRIHAFQLAVLLSDGIM
jgi:hypothetical protein